MKLEIDLADREEVAAAVPLLQLILDNTPATCGGKCNIKVTAPSATAAQVAAYRDANDCTMADAKAAVTTSLHAEFVAAQAADTRPPITGQSDPAVVFGGLPLPGPSAQDLGRPLTAAEAPAATFGAANVPPPPVATVPTPPHGSVELDAKGLPWDERIHASTKSKIANGEWKAKRGIPPERTVAVEAELRAALGNVAPPVAPTVTAPVPAAPVGVASPTISASVPAAPAADPTTFEQLMPRITAAVAAGQMPPTAVGAACAAHGLASVVSLQQNPQYVPLVWATLRASHPGV